MSGLSDKIGTVGARLSGLLAAGLLAVSCSPSTVPTGPDLALATAASGMEDEGRRPGRRDLESGVLGEINRYRAERGRAPLVRHAGLEGLARDHADAMMRSREISHKGFDRRSQAGESRYGLTWMAENVGWGKGRPEGGLAEHIVQRWIASNGHRKNLLRTNEYVGIGVARGADGSFWAAQLSARRESPYKAPGAGFGPPGIGPSDFDFGGFGF